MAIPRSRKLCILCSLLMGFLFGYSASVQLNDPGNLSNHPSLLFPSPMDLQIYFNHLELTFCVLVCFLILIGVDWYFWFPLYSCACIVNLTNCIISTELNRRIARLALWVGTLLFVKVVLEDFVYGISGILSLDLSERVVREKTGSLLVIISMILQMRESSVPNDPMENREKESSLWVKHGMLFLVLFSYVLPLVFFVVLKGEMKF